jgi:hypothetical protein
MAKNKMCDLRDHLFETIEKLNASTDPTADACEKMDVKTAEQISNAAGKIIDSYKVEIQALQILSKCNNLQFLTEGLQKSGIINNEVKQLGE